MLYRVARFYSRLLFKGRSAALSARCEVVKTYNLVLEPQLGLNCLTALVPTVLWGTVKKYGALRGRVAYRLKEQKRSRYKQSTLLIKDFKYGSSLSVLVGKNKEAQRSQVGQFFTLTNNTTAEFDSGSKFKE